MTPLDVGNITLEVLAEDDPHFYLIEEPFEFRRLLQHVKRAQREVGSASDGGDRIWDDFGGLGVGDS